MRKKESLNCAKCNCNFEWENQGDVYGGCKDRETIYCPKCNENQGSIMTSGRIIVRTID